MLTWSFSMPEMSFTREQAHRFKSSHIVPSTRSIQSVELQFQRAMTPLSWEISKSLFPSFLPPSLSPSLSLISSLSLSFTFFSLCLSLSCPFPFWWLHFLQEYYVICRWLRELYCCLVLLTFIIWAASWINNLLKVCKIQGWLCPVVLLKSEFHKGKCCLRAVSVAAQMF